jgi:DNA-binding MarR family transcriptional regulator
MNKPLNLRQRDSESAADERSAAIDFGPLEMRIGYALRRAQLAVFHDFFEAFSKLNLRPAQYSVLTVIEHNPGLPQGRVADALGIQKTNFVAMIAELERRGLVHREPSKQDRRIYALFLTRPGEKLMKKLHATAEEHEKRIEARIGARTYEALFAPLQRLAQDSES